MSGSESGSSRVKAAPMSADRLRALLGYDPETGLLVWLTRPAVDAVTVRWNSRYAGTVAGTVGTNGYITVTLAKSIWAAHRLIWYIQTGCWPEVEIDHKDLDTGNNRWRNLRLATRPQNIANRRSRAASGYKGVYQTASGKWAAATQVGGVRRYFPSRLTREEAYADYCAAVRDHCGEFARLS